MFYDTGTAKKKAKSARTINKLAKKRTAEEGREGEPTEESTPRRRKQATPTKRTCTTTGASSSPTAKRSLLEHEESPVPKRVRFADQQATIGARPSCSSMPDRPKIGLKKKVSTIPRWFQNKDHFKDLAMYREPFKRKTAGGFETFVNTSCAEQHTATVKDMYDRMEFTEQLSSTKRRKITRKLSAAAEKIFLEECITRAVIILRQNMAGVLPKERISKSYTIPEETARQAATSLAKLAKGTFRHSWFYAALNEARHGQLMHRAELGIKEGKLSKEDILNMLTSFKEGALR